MWTRSITSRTGEAATDSRCRAWKSWSLSREKMEIWSRRSGSSKPRGESGKMVSKLLPNLAELADDLCFTHSLTAKSNTHGPAENQMSTGFTLDVFQHRGLGELCTGERMCDLPASWRFPTPAASRQTGRTTGTARFCRRISWEQRSTPISRFRISNGRRNCRRRRTSVPSFLRQLNARSLEQHPGDTESRQGSPVTSSPRRCSLRRPKWLIYRKNHCRRKSLYGMHDSNPSKRVSPETACWPPALGTGRAVRPAFQWLVRDGEVSAIGTDTKRSSPIRHSRADLRSTGGGP